MQRARVVAVVVVCISLLAAAGLRSTSFACSGRKVLRGQKGMISDGPDKYLANAHCEWLIDGKKAFCMTTTSNLGSLVQASSYNLLFTII